MQVAHRYSNRIPELIEHPAFNCVWFYAIWLLLVLGRNDFVFLPLFLLAFHHVFVDGKRSEWLLVASIASLGICADSVISYFNVLEFENDTLMPLWLIVLWLAFASTINRGLKFLHNHIALAFIFGGIGGASSYISGKYFGAVEFSFSFNHTAALLFVHWAILTAVLVTIAKRFQKEASE